MSEIRTDEELIGTENINVVEDCYLFHPDRKDETGLLSGLVIQGNLKTEITREKRMIAESIHKDALESRLVVYKYDANTIGPTPMAYVLSGTAVMDLASELGVGRAAKRPFIERDVYMAAIMEDLKKKYTTPMKFVFKEFRSADEKIKSRYVLSIRKPQYELNSFVELGEAIGLAVDQSMFEVDGYYVCGNIEVTLRARTAMYGGFIPTIKISDSRDGNSSLYLQFGFETTYQVFLNLDEIKVEHRKPVDYEQLVADIIAGGNRLLDDINALKGMQSGHIELDIASAWERAKVEEAAAMKKNKRAITCKEIHEQQKECSTLDDSVSLIKNSIDAFDYTNAKLEKSLGKMMNILFVDLGIHSKKGGK
jgi:hypothetical protein